MAQDSLKPELIKCLAKLEDEETIGFLKQVEDANFLNQDGGTD